MKNPSESPVYHLFILVGSRDRLLVCQVPCVAVQPALKPGDILYYFQLFKGNKYFDTFDKLVLTKTLSVSI